jgi:hypothetical protein
MKKKKALKKAVAVLEVVAECYDILAERMPELQAGTLDPDQLFVELFTKQALGIKDIIAGGKYEFREMIAALKEARGGKRTGSSDVREAEGSD